MAETYVVNYDINVQSQQALNAFRQFQEATVQLQACMKPLEDFRRKVSSINTALNNMAKKAPVMNISTAKATEKLDAVLAKMERIHAMVRQMPPLNIAAAGAGTKKTASGGTSGQGTSGSNTVITGGGGTKGSGKAGTPAKAPAAGNVKTPVAFYGGGKGIPQNIGYRAFGQSMIDSGGVGAFSMMKGMGISYGIMGIGSLMGSAIKESVEYDNLMQTTRNILQTHDKYANFDERFKGMERTVRNVGVETKFTAAQVADASRFLAMAGFDVEGINKTIRPIADVALIGDTDLGATADVVTNIMTGYNIKPDEVRKAADILTMTFTKTNTELMDLAEAYKYSANLLNAGGISFEEATAGLGILGNVGMQGSQAGTTMRTIMANLVKPTKAQGKMWDKLGIERLDASGNVRALTDIFRDLSEAGVTLEDVYRMFHRTAAQGAMALVNNIEKWEEIE
ncbi:MAG: phage tail tape measure protein, partial [Dysgonamonadaceae bacterium]|nr:phage tail tape measure protein [Dysgonamonadaceae bacterium]